MQAIRGIGLELVKSYLCRRKIEVDVNRKLSNLKNLNDIDVPQGSVLGPLLFLISINDLPQCLQVNVNLAILFADDTAIYIKARDLCTLIDNLIVTFTSDNRWFVSNNLVPNFTETEFMVFCCSKRVTQLISCQELQAGENKICKVQSYRYLAVSLDPLFVFP